MNDITTITGRTHIIAPQFDIQPGDVIVNNGKTFVVQPLSSDSESNPDESVLAPGHNPLKLTLAQVGVKDGWRLLNENEIIAFLLELREIQRWTVKGWDGTGWAGGDKDGTYRTKLSPAELRKARGLK